MSNYKVIVKVGEVVRRVTLRPTDDVRESVWSYLLRRQLGKGVFKIVSDSKVLDGGRFSVTNDGHNQDSIVFCDGLSWHTGGANA